MARLEVVRLFRKVREEKGISLETAAAAIGMSEGNLSKFERLTNGELSGMRTSALRKYASFLGISIDDGLQLVAYSPPPKGGARKPVSAATEASEQAVAV